MANQEFPAQVEVRHWISVQMSTYGWTFDDAVNRMYNDIFDVERSAIVAHMVLKHGAQAVEEAIRQIIRSQNVWRPWCS